LYKSTAIVKVPVDGNISNPDLSVEMISDEIGMSKHNFDIPENFSNINYPGNQG
jgi:hypothetical protein